jgi:uncharacterized beta-barrel protein YwiB (DUF1934 family)
MKKEVLLSITGLQMSPDSDSDTTELFAPGEYYYRNDKHYLLYDEVAEGYENPTRNVIKVAPDYMELTKKGVLNVHMVFEKNKKNVTYYYTPYGSLLIGIDARRVEVKEQENHIQVEVEYGLEINYEHLADCHIRIEVQPQGDPAFRLS